MPYLSLLFGLKWKLTFRGFQRNKLALVGTVLALLFVAPMAIGMAIGTGVLYHVLAFPTNAALLRLVLLGIYGFWLLAPILGFALNESYDITKLLLYPIAPRQIFLGSLFSSLIDFPVLLTLPLFLAVLLGFVNSAPGAILMLIALVLFLFHTLALSQAIILASVGALRSRRWRDIIMVLGPLIGLTFYLLTQLAPRYLVNGVNWQRILENPCWNWVNYTPPGFAARAVGAAYAGAWWPAVGFLLLLTLVTVGTIYLAGYLVQLVSVGEGVSNPVRMHPASPTARQAAPATSGSAVDRWLPPVVAAVAEKEWKYLFRDPFFKMSFMQMLYMFVVIIVAVVLPRHGGPGMELGAVTLWTATGILLFGGTMLTFNIFGTDGIAATTLFLFPSSRRQIIFGKNLVMFLAEATVNVALLVTLHVLLRNFAYLWQQTLLLVMSMLVLIAAGNIISVLFPMRLVMQGWRMQQQSAGKGCGRGLVVMLGTFCCLLLSLPIATAVIVPTYWIPAYWFALTLPLAAAYAGSIYWFSLQITTPMLMQRETEIMATLLAEE